MFLSTTLCRGPKRRSALQRDSLSALALVLGTTKAGGHGNAALIRHWRCCTCATSTCRVLCAEPKRCCDNRRCARDATFVVEPGRVSAIVIKSPANLHRGGNHMTIMFRGSSRSAVICWPTPTNLDSLLRRRLSGVGCPPRSLRMPPGSIAYLSGLGRRWRSLDEVLGKSPHNSHLVCAGDRSSSPDSWVRGTRLLSQLTLRVTRVLLRGKQVSEWVHDVRKWQPFRVRRVV